jgi:acyl carrier protein
MREATADEREPLLLSFLQAEASRVLGFGASHAVNPRQPLNELGLDSLMAVELRNTLRMALGINLPATLLFNYPTLEALAGLPGSRGLRRRNGTDVGRSREVPSSLLWKPTNL